MARSFPQCFAFQFVTRFTDFHVTTLLGEELQDLVDALTELEARATEETDAAKKAVLLVQCRMAANNLKVGWGVDRTRG